MNPAHSPIIRVSASKICDTLRLEAPIARRIPISFVLSKTDINAIDNQVANGREALEIMDKQHIDLMVLDIMMPGMDGYELTEQLRSCGDIIPILMVTAKQLPEEKCRGFLVGTDDYMVTRLNNPVWADKHLIFQKLNSKEVDTVALTCNFRCDILSICKKGHTRRLSDESGWTFLYTNPSSDRCFGF